MKYLLLVVVLFVSCKKADKSLEACYMQEGTLTIADIPCDALEKNSLHRKVYYFETDNDDFMEKFASSYDKLQVKEKPEGFDVRIRLFYHHGKETDTICMGSFFGIAVNGREMEDSPELLTLVKGKIYK